MCNTNWTKLIPSINKAILHWTQNSFQFLYEIKSHIISLFPKTVKTKLKIQAPAGVHGMHISHTTAK